jgi:hypothetical protein
MALRRLLLAVLGMAIVVSCDGSSSGSAAAPVSTTGTTEAATDPTRVTVAAAAVPLLVESTLESCPADMEVGGWPLTVGVALPGFVLPDGVETSPGVFRLLQSRGDSGGCDVVRPCQEAAFTWIPVSGARESRGLVIEWRGRFYAFEAVRYQPGEGSGTRVPCQLAADQAPVVAWYAIQSVGRYGEGVLYWVWQEGGGDEVLLALVEE